MLWSPEAISAAIRVAAICAIAAAAVAQDDAKPLFPFHHGESWGFMDEAGEAEIACEHGFKRTRSLPVPRFSGGLAQDLYSSLDDTKYFVDPATDRKIFWDGLKIKSMEPVRDGLVLLRYSKRPSGASFIGLWRVGDNGSRSLIHEVPAVKDVKLHNHANDFFVSGYRPNENTDWEYRYVEINRHGEEIVLDETGSPFLAAADAYRKNRGSPERADSVFASAMDQEEQRWGILNNAYQWVVDPEWDRTWPFSCDLALIKHDNEFFFLHLDDAQAPTQPKRFGKTYEKAVSFSEGFAVVWRGKTWWVLDTAGEETKLARQDIKTSGVSPQAFSDGFAVVQHTDGFAYLRPDGTFARLKGADATTEYLADATYEEAWPCRDGIAVALKRSGAIVHLRRVVDDTGVADLEFVTPPQVSSSPQ